MTDTTEVTLAEEDDEEFEGLPFPADEGGRIPGKDFPLNMNHMLDLDRMP